MVGNGVRVKPDADATGVVAKAAGVVAKATEVVAVNPQHENAGYV